MRRLVAPMGGVILAAIVLAGCSTTGSADRVASRGGTGVVAGAVIGPLVKLAINPQAGAADLVTASLTGAAFGGIVGTAWGLIEEAPIQENPAYDPNLPSDAGNMRFSQIATNDEDPDETWVTPPYPNAPCLVTDKKGQTWAPLDGKYCWRAG